MKKKLNAQVLTGKAGRKATWQEKFPKTTPCTQYLTGPQLWEECGAECRYAFTVIEGKSEDSRDTFLYELHKNKYQEDECWYHDAVAIAVYVCPKCFHHEVLWNQA